MRVGSDHCQPGHGGDRPPGRNGSRSWQAAGRPDPWQPPAQPEGTSAWLGRAPEIRLLFVFDVEREAVILVAGDKAGQWNRWYRENIPVAEERYEQYVVERKTKEGLTQVEVAAILGVSQARISQIEHGQVDSLDTLRAYAEALGGEVSIVVSRGPLTLRVA
jgi:DNA-binding XRE family transcriptional regulator